MYYHILSMCDNLPQPDIYKTYRVQLFFTVQSSYEKVQFLIWTHVYILANLNISRFSSYTIVYFVTFRGQKKCPNWRITHIGYYYVSKWFISNCPTNHQHSTCLQRMTKHPFHVHWWEEHWRQLSNPPHHLPPILRDL